MASQYCLLYIRPFPSKLSPGGTIRVTSRESISLPRFIVAYHTLTLIFSSLSLSLSLSLTLCISPLFIYSSRLPPHKHSYTCMHYSEHREREGEKQTKTGSAIPTTIISFWQQKPYSFYTMVSTQIPFFTCTIPQLPNHPIYTTYTHTHTHFNL